MHSQKLSQFCQRYASAWILRRGRVVIILFGFPCCGKTSVGKRVSELLQCPFIDTDQEIEKIWNQKCHALARERGLAFFREEEEKMVSSLQPIQPSVISLGGGAILNAKNY